MGKIYTPPRHRIDNYGKINVASKTPADFTYLLHHFINDIILFDEGTQELFESGSTILPRYYFLFVGNKDGEVQYKPYEFNPYRIVVSTYKDIIVSIDSVG